MKTIGLTGGIACGKSTVAGLLRDRGVPVIDADRVARDVVAAGTPGLAAVVARFSDDVLQPDGALDRKALGRIVMADPAARRDLEAITHPRIFAGIRYGLARLEADGHPAAVVEAALMVETGSYRLYDALIVVAASPGVQRARLMAREEMDAATAERWMSAQLPVADKVTHATEAIWNDGDLAALEAAVEQAWERLAPQPTPAQV
jgi:dephospho-CoA kinase